MKLVLLTLSLMLASCASTNSQPKIQNKIISEKSLIVIETSIGNDVAYIHTGDDKEIFCSSSGNDFAINQSSGFSLSAKEASTSVGIGKNSSSGIVELGGINSGVLLSREVMYRTCEFMANLKAINGLTPEVAKQLYQKALDAVLKISTDYQGSTETGSSSETVTSTAPVEN